MEKKKEIIPSRLRNFNFVLINPNGEGKSPLEKGWVNIEHRSEDEILIKHIEKGYNYGVRCGNTSNISIDGKNYPLLILDFDSRDFQNEIISKLPETFTTTSGSPKNCFHLWFASDGDKSFKILDENKDTLCDVQGEGKQVIAPGSKHKSGSTYSIVKDIPFAFVAYSELKALLMPYDKTQKELFIEVNTKDSTYNDNFIEEVKRSWKMQDALRYLGVDTSKNPTSCPFHSSKGGKCLGFNNETAHCFHCEGKWNIFSLIMQHKNCNFKESLEIIADIVGMGDKLKESRKKYIEQQNEREFDEYKKIKLKYLELISGDKKRWDLASEVIVDFVKSKLKFYTTKDDLKNETWVYKDGIYIPQGKSEIKELLREILQESYTTYITNLVINKIEADTFIDSSGFFINNRNRDEICVKNGILDLKTRLLSPFTPEKIFFNKLPVCYNPSAKCPLIDKHFTEVLKESSDKIVLYELIGYCLEKTHFIEKAFMFIGGGRNGKGKTLELIKRLLGAESCCSVPLALMNADSFNLQQLFGKCANLAGDLSNTDLKELGIFKSLTGRDLISVHRKFLPDLIFTSTCKHIFACNELPKVYDYSKGFWSRWVLLEFPYEFIKKSDYDNLTKEEKEFKKIIDTDHIEKISSDEELSGLLNQALDGLDRLIKNKDFSYTIGTDEIKNIWIRKANSFTAFCYDCIVEKEGGTITKSDLRKYYNKYRKEFGLKGAGDKEIKATLEDLYGVGEGKKEVNDEWVNTWIGISYSPNQPKQIKISRVPRVFTLIGQVPYLHIYPKNPGNPGNDKKICVKCGSDDIHLYSDMIFCNSCKHRGVENE